MNGRPQRLQTGVWRPVGVGSGLVLMLVLGCGGVDASSPFALGALDPALLTNARSLAFSFSKTQKCVDLVDLSPLEIGAVLETAQEIVPLQILEGATTTEHVFGKVVPNVPVAFFVLASAGDDFAPGAGFGDLAGTVFAMGCQDFLAPAGTRHDLSMSLFPIGIR